MRAIVCELCGSNDIVKQGDYYFCQHCGTKYSLEEAKKLLGTVKIDTSEELKNLYEIARRAKSDNNAESAQKYYDMILVKDPKSWEAQFYSVYYRCAQCKIKDIENASATLANCLGNVLDLIKTNIGDEAEQAKAVIEVGTVCANIVPPFVNSIWKLYEPNGYNNNPDYFNSQANLVLAIISTFRREAEARFNRENEAFKSFFEAMEECEKNLTASSAERTKEERKKRGCYVATAVYGSYDCPQVWTLRRFRDYTLAETWYGRVFIHAYYTISPTIVKWFGRTEWFKNLWKPSLDNMVERLNRQGVADTPYTDRTW